MNYWQKLLVQWCADIFACFPPEAGPMTHDEMVDEFLLQGLKKDDLVEVELQGLFPVAKFMLKWMRMDKRR